MMATTIYPDREHIDKAVELINQSERPLIIAGHGVIIAAPHHGNWELLNQWLATRTPLATSMPTPTSAAISATSTARPSCARGGAGRRAEAGRR